MCQPTNERVTMILGAGASMLFFQIQQKSFLDTRSISDLLKDASNNNPIGANFLSVIPDNQDNSKLNLDSVRTIMNYYFTQHPNHNFEDVIHFIDITSLASLNTPLTANLFNRIMNTIDPNLRQNAYQSYGTLLRLLICYYEAILEENIFFNSDNHANTLTLIQTQRVFFNSLVTQNKNVTLMSLNYDSTIYRSIKQDTTISPFGFNINESTIDGNEVNFVSSPSTMFSEKVTNANDYLFPHGHMRLQVMNAQLEGNPRNVYFYTGEDVIGMTQNKIVQTLNQNQGSIAIQNNKINYNISIITGREKKSISTKYYFR